jgi:hypothetical protein
MLFLHIKSYYMTCKTYDTWSEDSRRKFTEELHFVSTKMSWQRKGPDFVTPLKSGLFTFFYGFPQELTYQLQEG